MTAASERWVSASRCSRRACRTGAACAVSERRSRSSATSASRNETCAQLARGLRIRPGHRRPPPAEPCRAHCAFDPTRAWSEHGALMSMPAARVASRFGHAAALLVERLRGRVGLQVRRSRTGVVHAVRARRRRGASSGAAGLPGAIRRAVTRKPVCPIILWLGRTAKPLDVPVPDQRLPGLRLGELAVRPERLDRSGRAGWWSRRTPTTTPPGARASRDRVHALPRREHVQHHPVDRAGGASTFGSASTRSPTVSARPGARRRRTGSTLRRATVGELLAALVRRHRPCRPDRPQQRAGQRARADPGLDDPAPRGRCRPSPTIWAASFG